MFVCFFCGYSLYKLQYFKTRTRSCPSWYGMKTIICYSGMSAYGDDHSHPKMTRWCSRSNFNDSLTTATTTGPVRMGEAVDKTGWSHVSYTFATSALIQQNCSHQLRCASAVYVTKQKSPQASLQTLMRVQGKFIQIVSINLYKQIIKMQIKICFLKHT